MNAKPPLPIFENAGDAKRYLTSFRSIVGGAVVTLVGVLLSVPMGNDPVPVLLVTTGVLLALAGQALYLSLNARVWARHYPDDPWDWRTARGFYEGTFRATLARARAMARNR